MKITTFLTAAALIAASTTASMAATISFGDVSNGASLTDTLGGEGSSRQLDFLTFSLEDAGPSLGYTLVDIDTLGSTIDTEIGLYDSDGKLIANNRNGDALYGTASRLFFAGAERLAAGDYTLVLGSWNVNFQENLTDNTVGGFPQGEYTVNITTEVGVVPLPAGGLLLLTGLIGVAALKRRKKRAA